MSINSDNWTRIAKNTYALKVGGATLVRYRYKGNFSMSVIPDVAPVTIPTYDLATAEAGEFTMDAPTTIVNIDTVKNLKLSG